MRRLKIALALAAVLPMIVAAGEPLLPYDPPVLGATTPRGTGTTIQLDPTTPSVKIVDGEVADWVGEPTGYGGTAVRSAGELVYADHLFDAYGADDGSDAERREILGTAEELAPETYRVEAASVADLPGQVGLPNPLGLGGSPHYGDLGYDGRADLVELRIGADAEATHVLARVARMEAPAETGVVLLFDRDGSATRHAVPFGTGLTSAADVAVLIGGSGGYVADLATGSVTALPAGSVASQPAGFTNALEARIDRAVLGGVERVGAVVGRLGASGDALATVANVAFRLDEPVREWFEQDQALALFDGTVDRYLQPVDLDALAAGVNERWVPGPGYHDRIFVSSTPGLAQEWRDREGPWQHYGVYLPTNYDGATPLPTTYWLHWRGGTAHVAATVSPGIMRHQGENRGGIVISPRGRGTSTWYVGRGHADILEVWDDVLATFPIDEDRVYTSGHSMGGWGSYLLPILYPDRFAGTFPAAGPVTQGAWTGIDFAGCDDYQYDDYTPCYIEANGSRPRDQHTRDLLENLRHVPTAMFYSVEDELVPFSGAVRQEERFLALGYRHRFYAFPAHEHFTHPIVDEWMEGVRYLDQFSRDPNPAHVTYVRDAAFERAVEEVQAGGIDFSFDFDRAYWMSGLQLADAQAGQAVFDGRSLAIAEQPTITIPEAGGPSAPQQAGPFAMTGLAWLDDPLAGPAPTVNAFEATLSGASGVTLDLDRMQVDAAGIVTATVTTDTTLALRLDAHWRGQRDVTAVADDGRTWTQRIGPEDGDLVIVLEPGTWDLTLERDQGPAGG